MSKYTLYVEGMHCASCELLIERKAKKIKGVEFVDAKLGNQIVEIEGDLKQNPETLAKELTKLVEKDGYTIYAEKPTALKTKNWREFYIAIPIALLLISLFLLLQTLGVVNIVGSGDIGLPAIFLIGFVASLSSCMAVIGGLVLSLSANQAKELQSKEVIKTQVLFHVSRLISFFILGGFIGLIGSAFTLSTTANFLLNLIIAVVMVILGLNLLELFNSTKKLQIKIPKVISHFALNVQNVRNQFTPLLLGIVTFFLPCGFTQSMQIYSLSTGNFINGAVTMFVFALGTLPVLALISFASVRFSSMKGSGIFFKVAGIIVIAFAVINNISAMAAIGLIRPVFNF